MLLYAEKGVVKRDFEKIATFWKMRAPAGEALHTSAYSAQVSYTKRYKTFKDTKKGGCLCRNEPTQNAQTLLSSRIPRDTEHERYHPELEEELKECLFCLQRNEMMFDLEVDTDLIEQRIYERQALLCRYRYLLAQGAGAGGCIPSRRNISLPDGFKTG